ncbi:hypothetical protein N8198_02875 [Gammaproteobacteria bacterium]|nr:hypothetical protein [Gammaproteobacteria bacterium]
MYSIVYNTDQKRKKTGAQIHKSVGTGTANTGHSPINKIAQGRLTIGEMGKVHIFQESFLNNLETRHPR